MILKNYPRSKLEHEILAIIGKHLDLRYFRVFFFGSRVSGKAHERSDVDVGIEGPNRIPSAVMAQIKSDLEELPTLYTVDLVDFKRVSDAFRSVAVECVESFHEVVT